MEDTKLEKLARLSGKATSKALDALGKHGFDIRGKLSAPISRVPRRVSAKNARLKGDPTSIYNWRRSTIGSRHQVSRPSRNWLISTHWASAILSTSGFTAMKRLCRTRRQVSAVSA